MCFGVIFVNLFFSVNFYNHKNDSENAPLFHVLFKIAPILATGAVLGGLVNMKHGVSTLYYLHYIKHKLNALNIMTIIGSKELTALSVSYCNSRCFSEKFHTHFHFIQQISTFPSVCTVCLFRYNIRQFRTTVTPHLQPRA